MLIKRIGRQVTIGVLAIFLVANTAVASIQTNIQTDFNVQGNDKGKSEVFVGAYKMFYRADAEIAQNNMVLLSEIVFEQETGISDTEEKEEKFNLERLFVIYTLSQNYQITFGRFHTNIGYWNDAFQRGRFFETTSSRPLIFGLNYIPLDYAGLELAGNLGQIGLRNTQFKAGIGSARNLHDVGRVSDIYKEFIHTPRAAAIAAEITAETGVTTNPTAYTTIPNPDQISPNIMLSQRNLIIDGSEFGGGYYRNYIDKDYIQDIYSGYLTYEGMDYEFMGEMIQVDQQLGGVKKGKYLGYYAQALRHFYFPIFYEAQKLYFRYDKIDLSKIDLDSHQRLTLGISMELNEVAILKFEVMQDKKGSEEEMIYAFQNAIYY